MVFLKGNRMCYAIMIPAFLRMKKRHEIEDSTIKERCAGGSRAETGQVSGVFFSNNPLNTRRGLGTYLLNLSRNPYFSVRQRRQWDGGGSPQLVAVW